MLPAVTMISGAKALLFFYCSRGPKGPFFDLVSNVLCAVIPKHFCRLIVRSFLSEVAQKFSCLVVVSRKNLRQIFVAHMAGDGFADDLTEVCGKGEVAAFVEL